MAHRGNSDPQHTIRCTEGAGRPCTAPTPRCDPSRNRARRSSGQPLGLHHSRAGSPGGGLSQDWVRHKAEVAKCGITYGGSLRGARSPGHGREPQQEDERRLRDPHVAVSPPRGGHRSVSTQGRREIESERQIPVVQVEGTRQGRRESYQVPKRPNTPLRYRVPSTCYLK